MCFRYVIIHTVTYYIFVSTVLPRNTFFFLSFFGLFQYAHFTARHELRRLFTYHSRYNMLQTGARILRKHAHGKCVYCGGRKTNFYWVTSRFLFNCKRAISHIAQPSGEYKSAILRPNYTRRVHNAGAQNVYETDNKGVAHRRTIILYT